MGRGRGNKMTSYSVTDPQTGDTTEVPAEDAPQTEAPAVSEEQVDSEAQAAQARAEAQDKADNSAEAAAKQFAEDVAFQNENPYSPIARAANPEVGGESFL